MFSFLNFKNLVLDHTEVVNLHDGMFPDQDETTEYLTTISPFIVRDFRRFVFDQMIDGCTPYSGKLAAQLYVLSLDWNNVVLSPRSFSYRLSKLSAPGVFDLFAQLPTESQEKIWEHDLIDRGFATNCTAEAYFSLLLKTDLKAGFCSSQYGKVMTKDRGEVDYLQIWYWSSEGNNRWAISPSVEPKLKAPSYDFPYRLKKVFKNISGSVYSVGFSIKTFSIDNSYAYSEIPVNFGNKATEGSVMLLNIYGEEAVTELLQTATESKTNLCLQDAILVLDSWQENRDYPLTWILHSVEGRHNHPEWKPG